MDMEQIPKLLKRAAIYAGATSKVSDVCVKYLDKTLSAEESMNQIMLILKKTQVETVSWR